MSGTLAGLSSPSVLSFNSPMPVTTFTTLDGYHSNIVPPGDASSDKSRRLIDQELQRLEDSIRALKSRRNVLAPISQLPPEMLSKVFAYRVSECAESANPLEWIRVTHVSRHWRAVAIDCPSLWRKLIFSQPRWSAEMLKRSKMASLIVKADLSCITPRIFEAVRNALLHSPRIHDLQLRASSATIARLLTSKSSFEVPTIHSLALSALRATRSGTDEGFTLPGTILTGEMPYLRKLEFRRVNIHWDSQLLKGLTHLTIHDVAVSARPTTDQLMNALERMPALEHFDIQDALPQPPNGPFPDRIVDLPQLAFLGVTSTVPACANLVGRIAIPPSARIHLSCSGTENTGGDFSDLMTVISHPRGTAYRQETKDSPPERKIIRDVRVIGHEPNSLVIHGWTNALTTHEVVPLINIADILFRFSWQHSSQTTVDSITASICKAIPTAHLRSLRMTYVNGISSKMWIDTFGLLPKLHSMHISGYSAQTLVLALREEVPVEALISPQATPEGTLGIKRLGINRRRSVPSVYFPHLRSLTLEHVSFEDFDTSASTTLFDLQSCLAKRSERKADIQELRLRNCSHLFEGDVDVLRKLVPTLDWDEIEQGFSEDEDSDHGLGDVGMGGYMFGDYDMYEEDLDYLYSSDFI